MKAVRIGVLLGGCLLLAAGSAKAAVIYVMEYAPGPTHDGTSWGSAFKTVQDAINTAHDGDEIWVSQGGYAGNLTAAINVSLYGGFHGTETDRSQRDPKAFETYVRTGSGPALTCKGADVTVDGFIMDFSPDGISVVNSGVATVRNNTIQVPGTGVAVISGTATVLLNTISGCTLGVSVVSGTALVVGNTIAANQVGVDSIGTVSLYGNTICGNNTGVLSNGGLSLVNNIVASNASLGVQQGQGYTQFLHNDVYNPGAVNYNLTPSQTGTNGNISLDPKLSSIYHDVHIEPYSPCRNAGTNSFATITQDIDGQPRIQDGVIDIGSDESDGTIQTVPSHIWYVSPTGKDYDIGNSWTTALKTMPQALFHAKGGDEIWVAGGTYLTVIQIPAGVAVYGGFAGNETARDQRNWTANPTIFDGAGSKNPVVTMAFNGGLVDGFTLRNSGVSGVTMGQGTIQHNVLTGNPIGVLVAGYGIVQENNCTANTQYGISVSQGSSSILQNNVSGNGSDGIHLDGADVTLSQNSVGSNKGTGIALTNQSLANLTSNSVGLNAGSGISISDSSICRAVGNVITANAVDGVYVTANSRADLINNTLEANTTGILVNGTGNIANLTNNIISFSTSFGIRNFFSGGNLTLSHNDAYGNTPDYYQIDQSSFGPGNISLDPLFVSTSPRFRSLHLKAGSPCIDAGGDTAVAAGDVDFDAHPRIIGPHVDLGAYEYLPPGYVTVSDVLDALRAAGGLSTPSSTDLPRLNVVDPVIPIVNLSDAVRLARKAAGLEANP